MVTHVTRSMTSLNGIAVQIDLGIAEDIQLLWDHGIKTFTSCEGTNRSSRYIAVWPEGALRAIDLLPWVSQVIWWLDNGTVGLYSSYGHGYPPFWLWQAKSEDYEWRGDTRTGLIQAVTSYAGNSLPDSPVYGPHSAIKVCKGHEYEERSR